MAEKMKFAVCGYGGAFGMGKAHADTLQASGRMELAAACDPDAARLDAARVDFPGIATFRSLTDLLAKSEAKFVVMVTPHNTHAPLAIEALKAGRHVVVEKPMCITTREARAMLRAAKAARRMLTVYHNRRWDGDYLALRQVVEAGTIGDVFNVRCLMAGYGMNTDWWRAKKAVTGGALYDWGAHIVDWILGLVPSPVQSVTGFSQKRVWMAATIEDEVQALMRFQNGAVGEVTLSHIRDMRSGTKWEVMGTKGNVISTWSGRNLEVTTRRKGHVVTELVPVPKTDYGPFYNNVVAHVLDGAKLFVTPESAARNIAVIEAQMKSAECGREVRPMEV